MTIITDREQVIFELKSDLEEARKTIAKLNKASRENCKTIERQQDLLDEKDRKLARYKRGHFAEI